MLTHGLCWVHTERLIHKLLPLNDGHREDITQVRDQIWTYYADLKDYKGHPNEDKKTYRKLEVSFWQYLADRHGIGEQTIPPLQGMIAERALLAPGY